MVIKMNSNFYNKMLKMNCLRRLIPSCTQSTFLPKRMLSKNLTPEESKQLYERLMGSNFNEKNVEASSFAQWLTPHYKFGPPRLLTYDWSMKTIYSWYKRKRVEFHKYNQRYIPDRVKSLGSDIAAAHFIVYRGGAVRFQGQDEMISWTDKKKEYYSNLPEIYDPNYYVEAIDASNIMIYYQGLENFKNLYKLKWLSLSNNPVLDNWSLDYIGHSMFNLEYLNISHCPQVTAAGVAGLHKLTQLKELVISNNNIEFQMACFALEDTIPELFVTMLDNNDTNNELLTKEKKLNVNEL